jgi:hypothetical protein
MDTRIQIVAVLGALGLLLFVLELVRRRRLLERYALLWLGAAIVLLGLSAWRDGLDVVAEALGIAAPTNAMFFVALGAIVLLLLHFSVAVSRLTDQTKVLAQRLAILEEQVREAVPPDDAVDVEPPASSSRPGAPSSVGAAR